MKPILKLSQTHYVKSLLRKSQLNTVCEESRCPNIGECFSSKTATFMILGDVCTRGCTFCNVNRGKGPKPSQEEPYRLLQTVKALDLKYVVLTSPTRDDLPDGGASHFAKCVEVLKKEGLKVEVLIPDFRGNKGALEIVLQAGPDVLNHNMETVKRLYPKVRIGANYERSLEVLRHSKDVAPHIPTKSAIILGFGETLEEVVQLLEDLRSVNCDFLCIGQYYQPSRNHFPVHKYYSAEEFKQLEKLAYSFGFRYVVSGPNVRSSYKAFQLSSIL